MTDVINLRRHRKAKARSEKEKKSAENRRMHGRTKQERESAKNEAERAAKLLDAHKRETDDEN